MKNRLYTLGVSKSKQSRTPSHRFEVGKWLGTLPWHYYLTLTTYHDTSLKSARRLMRKFHRKIQKSYPAAMLYWVAEGYKLKDGCHTHGLLNLGNVCKDDLTSVADFIREEWRVLTKGKKWAGESNKTDVQEYVEGLGANFYVVKDVERRYSDWDIELGAEQNDSYVQDTSFSRKRVYRRRFSNTK